MDGNRKFIIDSATLFTGTFTKPDDLSKLTELGLTTDGVKVEIVPVVHDVDFDGKLGRDIKGMSRILGYTGTVSAKGLELSDDLLALSVIKEDTLFSGSEGYKKYIPSVDVDDSVYKDIIVVGRMNNAKPAVIVMKNVFNSKGLSITTKDSDEGSYDLELKMHYDIDGLLKSDAAGTTVPPVEIYLPTTD